MKKPQNILRGSVSSMMILAVLLLPGISWSAITYFVDYENGNDSNSGISRIFPWKRCPGMVGFTGSYSHTAGDQFIFKGGVTWPSAALPLDVGYSGTSGNRDAYTVDQTWYSGSSWSQPVFDMELTDQDAINVQNRQYVTINNIKAIKPAPQTDYKFLVYLNNSDYITVQNCTIDAIDCPGSATPMQLRNTNGCTVEGTYLRSMGVSGGNPDCILIRPWFDMTNITIRNNEITTAGTGGDGIHIDLNNDNSDTLRFNYGPILIENNSFHDISGGKMGICVIGGAIDLTIRYNKFYGDYATGVGVRFGNVGQGYDMDGSAGGPYYWWFENCQVYYNLFYQTCDIYPSWGAMISHLDTQLRTSLTVNNHIYNNVLWANGTYPNNQRGMFWENDNGAGWTVKNNIFAGLKTAIAGLHGYPQYWITEKNLFYNNQSNGIVGNDPVYGDPRFIDPGNGNFQLQSGSAAIDSGVDWGQIRDFTGNALQGSAWDIGAYEYLQDTGNNSYVVAVYPNPCRIYQGENTITFIGDLSIGDNIRIFDIGGRTVHDSGSLSEETYEWVVSNITSGIYLFIVKSSDGQKKTSGKIAVIR